VYDLVMAVAFMTIVFGLAASILFVFDRFTARSKKSAQEREAVLTAREGRWIKRYKFFMLVMAVSALVVGAFNGNRDEPMPLRIFFIFFAATYVIFYVRSK
jgi:Na+/H+ antiporter NhaD/arsenite permease-like protein